MLGRAEVWVGPRGRLVACGLGREKRRVRVAGWAAEMGWAGAGLSLVLGSFSIPSSLLFLIKQSLNSNTNLNSNHTQIIKTMHQHLCNNKN